MSVSRILVAGLFALLIAGCATRGPASDAPVLRDPAALAAARSAQAERQAWLEKHTAWSFSGRVAVNANGKGGSGRIDWQQGASAYEVALSAPVTRQSWRLSGDTGSGGGRLEGLEGGTREGADAEGLLREATGWDIPVASMAQWARGLEDPAVATGAADYGADGRLRTLRQRGWRVDYMEWSPAEAGQPAMPRRIEARREGATVKLAIDQWQLASP
ncbi:MULTISPECIES: lipoprotein insertase outer membrane protein LolB [unclassified Pseudoxanthomonas]|uniref:lipoprotein insertase outer membrane protein LolB n=1 Tax=unclassified Pseudoxanthomonas TaxID=2645906 RepID=UPI0008F3354E|nr:MULTISPECIES: lipoprotein insertase outer membrane protein LolB [unclassified Pseudoxanthomonas]PPJ41970.1 outer membrane lipoprotein LolB [Pseudoxanthomonas sp. KAs_5_3]SFV29023.1 outer membrane lipoprotein LolB [Pseudoxanthomonas sp. YR558]